MTREENIQNGFGRLRAVYLESGRTSLEERERGRRAHGVVVVVLGQSEKRLPSFATPSVLLLHDPRSTFLQRFTTEISVALSITTERDVMRRCRCLLLPLLVESCFSLIFRSALLAGETLRELLNLPTGEQTQKHSFEQRKAIEDVMDGQWAYFFARVLLG
jgi:hypothetical protein